MALNILKPVQILKPHHMFRAIVSRVSRLYEPDYLETGKPKIPIYPTLNIQVKGYVYSILEKYHSLVFKIVKRLDFDFDDSWAMPPQKLQIQRFKLNTANIDKEYSLCIYERNIQLSDIPAAQCPLLIKMLEAALPEGVTLNVTIYDSIHEQKRYVPDKSLLDLQTELKDLLDSRTK